MIDTPKRRFWQIHLSTAVVLMFASGTLLWANLNISIETKVSPWRDLTGTETGLSTWSNAFQGFPFKDTMVFGNHYRQVAHNTSL